MKELKKYTIDIFGLSNSDHSFEFPFEDGFFAEFENSLVEKGSGVCEIDLNKTDSMITMTYRIRGSVRLVCDRSLDEFDFPVDSQRDVIYKYGIEEQELSEDVYTILKDTQQINIADFLYQFISLEIPMKKLHPRYDDESDDDEMIFKSESENSPTSGDETDPRWEALKKLK